MENNRTYTGNISVSIFKPNYNISFHNHAGEKIGILDFNTDRLVFTGNAEESAKVFIDFIAQSFAKRLEEERQAEREACAKLCDEQGQGRFALEHYAALTYAGATHDCAAAIRARSE
jgi:hypothetical protein